MFQVGSVRFEQPILLAPMEDVTERPFRLLCRRYGADMVYTEFVSAEGLIRAAAKTRAKIALAPEEHPVGIQIYGNREEALVEAAQLSEAVGPELIDINFGCPAKKIACKASGIGAGAGLLQDPDLLVRLTAAVVRSVRLPVTVKTRLGWDSSSIIIEDLARRLEDVGVQAITLHARTRCQAFKGQADWSWIARVKRAVRIPVIGNGDVREPGDVQRMFEETGCDAVMIGRAAVGNPWIFSRAKAARATGVDPGAPGIFERVAAYFELLDAAVALKGEPRGVFEMRKHLSGYLKEAHAVSHLRARLMQQTSRQGVREEIDAFLHGLRADDEHPLPAGEPHPPLLDQPRPWDAAAPLREAEVA